MIDPITLATTAAVISAMVDVVQLGSESFQTYLKRRQADPSLPDKERALEIAFSTFSAPELRSIHERIESCRQRFIEEGSGKARRGCICSVLRDVREGNGGTIPDSEWEKSFQKLKCEA